MIDRLPRNSQYVQAVSSDEEYAERLAEAQKKAGDGQPYAPPMSSYSPEVEALSAVVDAVRGLQSLFIKANGGKDVQFPAYPRPRTAFDKARAVAKYRKHEKLAARLLQRGPKS